MITAIALTCRFAATSPRGEVDEQCGESFVRLSHWERIEVRVA